MQEQEPISKLKILFLESFYGGSHKDFALGLKEYSQHEIDLKTLPDKNWKSRMRVTAFEFARQTDDLDKYDLIFATDMMNLADFMAMINKKPGMKRLPAVLYFHENQLTYPTSSKHKTDPQFGFINISSALCATKLIFNSKFHLDEFMAKTDKLIKNTPDFNSDWVKQEILSKVMVLYPGCRFSKSDIKLEKIDVKTPVIIWNHRWEWDKNPEDFFWALKKVKEKKIPFKLALLGERYENIPHIFQKAKLEFADELIQFDYVELKDKYMSLLSKGAIVVSTSLQENFGISVVEAVRAGCVPVLPSRLSYPEIMPEEYLKKILYTDKNDLVEKLTNLILNYQDNLSLREKLSLYMRRYSWQNIISQYDIEFEKVVKNF